MIALLLTTKDEGDVLEENVRHHLAFGVDHVCVADNRSTDGTLDRLRQFGDRVSVETFDDFAVRQQVRRRLLDRAQERFRRAIEWAGVADTDEFFWRAGATSVRDLLVAPDDVVCVTFHQKLFLPSELDPADGPVHVRQTWRTTSYASPRHTSWVGGKSFYRTSWLREITHEHREPSAPHPWWGPEDGVVHHYMIRDEDQFVMKVKRLVSWRPRTGLSSKPWWHALRAKLGLRPERPYVSGFKMEWWTAYETGGEEGLRRYYRDVFRLTRAALPKLAADGHVVEDRTFAEFELARRGSAVR